MKSNPSAAAIQIRELARTDLPSILRLEADIYEQPWSSRLFADELNRPAAIRLAAVNGDEIVGYLFSACYGDIWHVMNVAVALQYRRRGIARQLLRTFLLQCGVDDDREFTLEVRVSNVAARKLYAAFDFCDVGVRPRYYPASEGHPCEDALIMTRDANRYCHVGFAENWQRTEGEAQ